MLSLIRRAVSCSYRPGGVQQPRFAHENHLWQSSKHVVARVQFALRPPLCMLYLPATSVACLLRRACSSTECSEPKPLVKWFTVRRRVSWAWVRATQNMKKRRQKQRTQKQHELRPLIILIIDKSGRLHVIAWACRNRVAKNVPQPKLYAFSEVKSPALSKLCEEVHRGRTDSVEEVTAYARKVRPDFVIIGPEEPLFAGIVDALEEMGIPCIGPRKDVARIEWSKAFARRLLAKHFPTVNPRHRIFSSVDGVSDFLRELGEFVIKPDGLTGGKGVKVSGDHLSSVEEAVEYCRYVFASGHSELVVEERIDGEEFTLQSFCDGTNVVHTIPVQDHKRLLDGDKGPNTGGMGSYTCADHSLPFLTHDDLSTARKVNELVAAALREDTGIPYKGILYGGFIATQNGVKVIEFNSRFGDPEVMNVLPLLQTDFVSLCQAIINGTLSQSHVHFANLATVCKYVVPAGYPGSKEATGGIRASDVPKETENLRVFHAAIDEETSGVFPLTASRALAVVGIGDSLEEAATIAENAAAQVSGPVHHRKDIGSSALIKARIDHMNALRPNQARRHKAA